MHHLVDDIEEYPADENYDDENYDTDEYSYDALVWPSDRRWRPVVAFVGAVVALGAVATAVIINSGDSATTRATVGAPTPTPVPAMTTPSGAPTTSPSPGAAPPPPRETITTVPSMPSMPPRPSSSPMVKQPLTIPLPPDSAPTVAPPPVALPPQSPVSPRTVVYSVTGTKQLIDLVNIVYTDARGFPVTEFNVALPWTRAVVLNPGVQTESVVATSLTGKLSCAIVNAQGQLVKASATGSMIATCTR